MRLEIAALRIALDSIPEGQSLTSFLASVLVLVLLSSVAAAQPGGQALPVIDSAGTDERGRIVVNGKLFLPILMYDVPVDGESLNRFREHHFNVLSCPAEDAEALRRHGLYAAAHSNGKSGLDLGGVLFGVGMDSPALYWKENLLEKSRADLANMRKLFPRRPILHAIGYWEAEPEGVFSNRLPRPERYEELVAALDVSAPYLYPLPYQPLRSVGQAVGRAAAASGGGKALLPVLQLFVWKPGDRYPSPAELKCMVWLSLIHGADGIGYYSYNYVSGKHGTNIAAAQPELWKSVKAINAEIKVIGEFLLRAQPDPSVEVVAPESAVEWRAATDGAGVLLMLTNTSPAPCRVRIRWPSEAAELQRIGGDKTVHVRRHALDLTLRATESLALRGTR